MMQLYHCRVTTAIGDEKMNEYGCVLVKVVLQTQAVRHVPNMWSMAKIFLSFHSGSVNREH